MTNFGLFTIIANFTDIGSESTLEDAKAFAVEESLKYDDIITINQDGLPLIMAQGGQLYTLTPTR